MISIGVTETYDPCHDFSWVLNKKDVNILITKNLTDAFIEILTSINSDWHYSKCNSIVHLTCTGWGGTWIEPKVPTVSEFSKQVTKLLESGFPVGRLVLRIDPIIPTIEGIQRIYQVLSTFQFYGIERVRVSVLDMYKHVRDRFLAINTEESKKLMLSYGTETLGVSFHADEFYFDKLDEFFSLCELGNYRFESCGELANFKNIKKVGCVSEFDLNLFGIPPTESTPGGNRKSCNCLNKSQLISGGMSRGRCPNECVYCYLK